MDKSLDMKRLAQHLSHRARMAVNSCAPGFTTVLLHLCQNEMTIVVLSRSLGGACSSVVAGVWVGRALP